MRVPIASAKIAKVDAAGVITAFKKGSVNITIAAGGKKLVKELVVK